MMPDVLQHKAAAVPAIRFTNAAMQRVLAYLSEDPCRKGIRLSVKKTGCSGLSYVVDYIESPTDGDITFPLDQYMVCIDHDSYPYLNGMEIDYVKQGLNQKFVFNNPNQTGECGCGESFTVD
jgi:iron-sulfur cluster assembly protein